MVSYGRPVPIAVVIPARDEAARIAQTVEAARTALSEAAGTPDETPDAGGTLDSHLTVGVEAGTYFISVGAYADDGVGSYQLDITSPTIVPLDLDNSGRGQANGLLPLGNRNLFSNKYCGDMG